MEGFKECFEWERSFGFAGKQKLTRLRLLTLLLLFLFERYVELVQSGFSFSAEVGLLFYLSNICIILLHFSSVLF